MARFNSKPEYTHGDTDSVGILLVNLGTPEKPTANSVRTYLREFLSDYRVIEIPKFLWLLILYLFILPLRPFKSAKAYQEIWTKNGSPLLFHSQRITEKLKLNVNKGRTKDIQVELAMSYGEPSIDHALEKFYENSVRRIFLLPLYPQYSNTTTGSVFENVTRALAKRRWIPEFRFINHYHDEPIYTDILAESIKSFWKTNGRGEKLLFSFHGLPHKMLIDGDPYHCQCLKTARLITEKLSLKDDEWFVSFQSRLGRAKWLEPYTEQTLINWGENQGGVVDVICPGFAADCLETLEEIAMQNKEFYTEAGGRELRYIPALNSDDSHISMLNTLVTKNLSDWLVADSSDQNCLEAKKTAYEYSKVTQKSKKLIN
jgi:ferrochelatase